MLERDIQKRPSIPQVMEDEWFQEKLLKRKMDEHEKRNVSYHLKNMQIYKVKFNKLRYVIEYKGS